LGPIDVTEKGLEVDVDSQAGLPLKLTGGARPRRLSIKESRPHGEGGATLGYEATEGGKGVVVLRVGLE